MPRITSHWSLLGSLLVSIFCASIEYGNCAADTSTKKLRPAELDQLVEPIALYPDNILKALLPASTFPDQIVDAGLLIRTKADASKIKEQSWDESVKVVATYPGVLKMMFEELPWTQELGNAFLAQHPDVFDAIQRMRTKAKELGNLKSNQYQNVSTQTTKEGETVIVVQPANPEVVYVPQTTETVYTNSNQMDPLVPLVSFGLGMAVGAALDDDDDDYYGPGYWGGPVYWGGDDDFDDWADYRQDRWEDYDDRRRDAQDHRQNAQNDRREFRQDAYEDGARPGSGEYSAQRKEQAKSRANEYKANNPEAAARVEARKSNPSAQPRTSTASRSAFDSKTTSGSWGTADAWRNSNPSQANRSSTYGSRSTSGGGAFGGSYSGRSASTMSSRGSMSRGGGGGFSRGGGGGGRGRR